MDHSPEGVCFALRSGAIVPLLTDLSPERARSTPGALPYVRAQGRERESFAGSAGRGSTRRCAPDVCLAASFAAPSRARGEGRGLLRCEVRAGVRAGAYSQCFCDRGVPGRADEQRDVERAGGAARARARAAVVRDRLGESDLRRSDPDTGSSRSTGPRRLRGLTEDMLDRFSEAALGECAIMMSRCTCGALPGCRRRARETQARAGRRRRRGRCPGRGGAHGRRRRDRGPPAGSVARGAKKIRLAATPLLGEEAPADGPGSS